ncbi:fimbria/pilus periplasmic chaperone [Serratia fonticola]|uniref:fimbria/pilus periplasmic chaperone n=1 Tax=Serratia fonticola TaxID=47917 RepID=UPI00192D0055|nr:fimbria/pilus periplasmic chaperone [Serratia fonticola]MBL5825927.1 fimbria/pilus periplasmic chaperone [Serratia fonticola]
MKFLFSKLHQALGLVALVLFSSNSLASVVISGTRVIYPSDATEVSVKLDNAGSLPVLLQSWIDNGDIDARPASIKVPFVLTPPMNRIEPGKGQTLRISYTHGMLPMDRESVFWLNTLEIPAKHQAKADENLLQMAFRSRIKLFYRPAGLEGNANDAANMLTWNSKGTNLQAVNSTPYYISLIEVKVNGKKVDAEMIAPKSTREFNLSGNVGNKVTGSFVNDFGAIDTFESIIK